MSSNLLLLVKSRVAKSCTICTKLVEAGEKTIAIIKGHNKVMYDSSSAFKSKYWLNLWNVPKFKSKTELKQYI